MNQDEIIEMARQAGFPTDYDNKLLLPSVEIEAFAKLIAAKERENIAQRLEEFELKFTDDVIRAEGEA